MKNKKQAFLNRWQETTDIPPQTVGPITPLYKEVTKRLKIMPFPLFIVLSIVIVGTLLYALGPSITKLASVLQKGF
jgi:hypothetical protein